MTTSEFKSIALKNNVVVYSVKSIAENRNKGFEIVSANKLNETTITAQKTETYFNQDLSEIATILFNGNDSKVIDVKITTTGNLFNHTGILQYAGDYAGKYQQEAYDLLNLKVELKENEWCDIMHDEKGNCFAVYAEDELTCQNADCLYLKMEVSDCEQAYNEAQTHLDE